jgi:WD40 repeat protein
MSTATRFRIALLQVFALLPVALTPLVAQDKGVKVVTTFHGHSEPIYAVAVSPDGSLVATGSWDKSVKLFEAATGKEIRTLAGPQGHQKMVLTLAFSPDGRTLASGSEDNTLKLWDIPSQSPLRTLAQQQALHALALSPDGTKLAVGGQGGLLKVFNVADFKEALTLPGHTQTITRVAFSANGQVLASASQDQTVRFWNTATGQPLGVVGAHRGGVQNVALHPNGAAVYSVGDDGLLKYWTLPLVAPRALPGHKGDIFALTLSADGSQVLTGGADQTVRGFAFANGAANRQLTGLATPLKALALHPAGTMIAAGSGDGKLSLWTANDNKLAGQYLAHNNGTNAVAFQPQGAQIMTGGADGTLRTWTVPPLPAVALTAAEPAVAAALSTDGKRLVAGGADKILRTWDLGKGALDRQFPAQASTITAVATSGNGQLLASAGIDGTIRFWNPATGKENDSLGAEESAIQSLVFHPTGTQLASASAGGSVKVWQLPLVAPKAFVHADRVTSVAVSPDGTRLLTGCGDKVARLWNLATGAKEREFTGPALPIGVVLFSPDGNTVAAASADKALTLWKTGDAKQVHKVALAAVAQCIAFSPDSKTAAVGLADGSVHMIETATGKATPAQTHHQGGVTGIAYIAADAVLTAGTDKKLQLWTAKSASATEVLEYPGPVESLALGRDGKRLAILGAGVLTVRELGWWDAGAKVKDASLSAKVDGRHVAFSPDSKRLVVTGKDQRARVYGDDGRLHEFFSHDGPALAAAFVDGKRLVTAGADKTAQLRTCAMVQYHQAAKSVHQVAFGLNGSAIFFAMDDETFLWPFTTAPAPQVFTKQSGLVRFSLNADGSKLALVAGKKLAVWSTAPGKAVKEAKQPLHEVDLPAPAQNIALSADGSRAAVGYAEKTGPAVQVLDVVSGHVLQDFHEPAGPAQLLSFMADPRALFVVAGKSLRRLDAAVSKSVLAHQGGVVSVQYHANGTQALSAGADNAVKHWDLAKGVVVKEWGPFQEPVRGAVFSRDFTQVAAAVGKTVRVWNLADGKELANLPHPADVLSLSFNFDKTRLATGCADKMTRVWDLASGQELQFFPQEGAVRAVAFHNGNVAVLSAAGGKQVTIDSIAATRVVKAGDGPVQALAIAPNGAQILTAGADKQVSQWNSATGVKERSFASGAAALTAVAVAKNNALIASAGADKVVHVFNVADGKEIKSVDAPAVVRALAFSPNSGALAASCADGKVQVWHTVLAPGQPTPPEFLKPMQTFAHAQGAADVVFAADNQTLFSCGLDKNVQSWKLALDAPAKQFVHPQNVACVAFHPSGTKVATGAADGKVRIYDLAKGVVQKEINAHPKQNATMIYGVAFHPKLDQVASAGYDGSVKLWDANTGNLVAEYSYGRFFYVERPGHRDNVYCLAFSPDGKYLATGSAGQECLIKIWDLSSGSARDLHNPKLKRAAGFEQSQPGWIYGLSYTRDGKHLVAAGLAPRNKGYISLWDAQSGNLLLGEELPLGAFYSLALMPGDRQVLVGAGTRGKSAKDLNKAYVLELPDMGK